MLSREENETITRTGPGTPMGSLFREYWLPALLSTELPRHDSDPVRVMLLSEKLIAFRDTNGQVGLVADSCPHRGASLFFGRNEECGLRCVYHGWKFDVSGACVDMPNEPAESNFKHKVKAVAYPCQERGGIVWAYLGPRSTPPPLPDLEPNMLPLEQCWVTATQRECNWLQGLEGDIDTSHAGFLHSGSARLQDFKPGSWRYYMARDKAPKFAAVDTVGGAMYTAWRDAEPGYAYHRLAQFLLPAVTMTPNGILGRAIHAAFSVPMDDEHTMRYSINATVDSGKSIYKDLNAQNRSGRYAEAFVPNTTDWFGRGRLTAHEGNDYLMDRERQRQNLEYSGIKGILEQDQAITESEGKIYDRTTEHLGTTDLMIIQVRRRMLSAVRSLMEDGITPPGVDNREAYHVRSGEVVLPIDADWIEATKDLRQAFQEHSELERLLPAWTGDL